MTRIPMASVDTAWLRMEDPTNLMMINGVMIFSAPLDMDRFRATIEERLLRFDRFKQRAVQPWGSVGRAYWEDDPRFDLDVHIKCVDGPPPKDEAELSELVSSLMSTQLDFKRPLWRFDVIERFGKGSAIIARLHHCIADGIVLVQVLLSLTDAGSQWPQASTSASEDNEAGGGVMETLAGVSRASLKTAGGALQGLRGLLASPGRLLGLGRQGLAAGTALARLVLRWPDPKTIFKGPLGQAKVAAWSTPLPLPEVKRVGRWLGGTVNDVLLTAVTGGLRRYLQARGEAVTGLDFRAVVPVSLRAKGEPLELGNRFSLVFLVLPVGVADPIERFQELKRRMDDLKGSQEPAVAFGILNAVGVLPEQIQDVVINIFGTKGTAVMTNVPGPTEPISLAGAPVDMLMAWVPQAGHLGMGVSIVSYAGQVRLGVTTDAGLVADPEAIIDGYRAEFDRLLDMARRGLSPRPRNLPSMLDDIAAKVDGLRSEVENASAGEKSGDG